MSAKEKFEFQVTQTKLVVQVNFKDFDEVPEIYEALSALLEKFSNAFSGLELTNVEYSTSDFESYYFELEFKKSA